MNCFSLKMLRYSYDFQTIATTAEYDLKSDKSRLDEISGGNVKEINVWLFVYLFVKHALVYY